MSTRWRMIYHACLSLIWQRFEVCDHAISQPPERSLDPYGLGRMSTMIVCWPLQSRRLLLEPSLWRSNWHSTIPIPLSLAPALPTLLNECKCPSMNDPLDALRMIELNFTT